MVHFTLHRFFVNAILTFIFLYVDIISRQVDQSRPDIVLIAIAIYGSFVILLKTLLAVYHQLKWLFFERCCITELVRPDEQKRVNIIDEYWGKVFEEWKKKSFAEIFDRNSIIVPQLKGLNANKK